MKLEIKVPLGIQVPLGKDFPDIFHEAQRAFWNTDIGRCCCGSHVELGRISAWSNGAKMNVDSIMATISTEMRDKEPIAEDELVRLMLKYNGRLLNDD